MKIRLLKASQIQDLLNSIELNLKRYRKDNFEELEIDGSKYIEIDHEFDAALLSKIDCDPDDHREVQNCIEIFKSLESLSLYLARDERIWIYLTHTYLLNYTRKRWPIPENDDKAIGHIKNHFFAIGARGIERDNAASRLWWMASLCNRILDLELKDALTAFLHNYDVPYNIIGRPTTSQSIHIFSALLRKLDASYKGDQALFIREKFRSVMRQLNRIGGIKLLSAMSEDDVSNIIDNCIKAV